MHAPGHYLAAMNDEWTLPLTRKGGPQDTGREGGCPTDLLMAWTRSRERARRGGGGEGS